MRTIYEFPEFRQYLDYRFQTSESGGHGLRSRMADAMGASSSLVSQILAGKKTMTPEQVLSRFFVNRTFDASV